MGKNEKGERTGVLDGLSKQFFLDVPYSHALTRSEQILREEVRGNELARQEITELKNLQNTQQQSGSIATQSLQEAQTTRKEISHLLEGNILSNLQVDGRLEKLHQAVEAGMENLGDIVTQASEDATGIPTHRKGIEELLNHGALDESEAFILTARGVLDRKHGEKLLNNMPQWKLDLIQTGLVTKTDPKVERGLSNEEKLFLADLRRKMSMPTAHFRSLETAARHGLLDRESHHSLAKQIREVRFGTEGTNYGMRELNQQADTLIHQGQSRLKNDQIAISQREVANRLVQAGILQGSVQIDLARESLSVQRSSAGDLSDLKEMAEKAHDQREIIAGHAASTAKNTAIVVALAANTSAQIGHYGELQASQMIEAQSTRLEAVALTRALVEIGSDTNILLENIRHGISTAALSLTNIEDGVNLLAEQGNKQLMRLADIEHGISILGHIAAAQLETQEKGNQILNQLRIDAERHNINIVNVIEAVRLALHDIEAGQVAREFHRDQIGADEAYREAVELMKFREIDEAIKCFTKSQERWSLDYRPYYQRGLCYVLGDKAKDAEKDFKKAIQRTDKEGQEKTNAIMWLNLARLHYAEARTNFQKGTPGIYEEKLLQAIESARQAVEKCPEFLEAQFALATYLAAFKLLDEALRILLNIIPLEPNFAEKVRHFDVFEPLMDSLTSTLEKKFNDNESAKAEASLAIARDSMRIGDFEIAEKLLKELIQRYAAYLNKSRIWEVEEFKIILEKITNLIREELEKKQDRGESEAYALTSIALRFSEIPRGKIYQMISKTAKIDSDILAKDGKKTAEKLRQIFTDKYPGVVAILKTGEPRLAAWLLKSL